MRKSFEFSATVRFPDGKQELRYLTVRAVNEEKARKFFVKDLVNLLYCSEKDILRIKREG